MLTLSQLVVTVILLSLTGALAPGPLTMATIVLGTRGGARAGFLTAVGHMIFEFPYFVALCLIIGQRQVLQLLNMRPIKLVLAVIALAFILYFSILTLRDGISLLRGQEMTMFQSLSGRYLANPLVVGFLLTSLNPQFLTWWITVGLIIVIQTAQLGLIYIPLIYITHVWLDYAWLTALAFLSHKGYKVFRRKYGYVLIALAVLLAIFGSLIVVKVLL